jgi:hypothetical protein
MLSSDLNESITNWPPGSGSINQDQGTADPDPGIIFTGSKQWFERNIQLRTIQSTKPSGNPGNNRQTEGPEMN